MIAAIGSVVCGTLTWIVVDVPATLMPTVAVLAAAAAAAATSVAAATAATSAARRSLFICGFPFLLFCICQLVVIGLPSTCQ